MAIFNLTGSTEPTVSDGSWGDYLFSTMPGRMRKGYAGAFFTFIPSLLANTIEVISYCGLMARNLSDDESPDDILPLVGKETGIVQYFSESNDAYRERIIDRWDALPNYGKEFFLTSSLYTIGAGNFSNVELDFNLGGTDVPVGPSWPSGSVIQPYLPSSQNFYQFNVVITVSTPNSPSDNIESRLIPDKQLNSVRTHIKLIRPVDFYCKEIVLIYAPNSSSYSLWDDGVSTWDDGSTVWDDADSSAFQIERHKP